MKLATLPLVILALAPGALSQSTLPGTDPQGLNDLYGQVLFAATEVGVGSELYRATTAGGALLVDLNPGPDYGIYGGDSTVILPAPLEGVVLGADLYFYGYLANDNIGLFRTDGSVAGTYVIQEFAQIPGPPGYYFGYPFEAVALGELVVGCAKPHANSWGVWATDGTSAGMQLLTTMSGASWGYTRLGNEAIFIDYTGGWRLWRTDGTPAGTLPFHSFPLGTWVEVDSLTVLDGVAYFSAEPVSTGSELWRTDGTAAGTSLVLDIHPGSGDADPEDLVRVGDAIYFSANDGTGRDVWRTDGTAAGTTKVASVPSGSGAGPRHLTALGERLFFAHENGSSDELYVFDHGTGSLDQLAVLTGFGEVISNLAAIGSRRVFFRGTDGTHGKELWVSDGTSAGTHLHEDVLGGSLSSNPEEMMLSDGKLFFVARSAVNAEALHHRDVGATAQPIGVGCSSSGRLPYLTTDDPVLGGMSQLRLDAAEPSAPVLVFLGPSASPTGLGSGCFAHLDLAALSIALTGSTDPAGEWTSASFPLPSDLALTGIQLSIQAIVGPTATQPLGFDLSSAVLLTFGS